MQPLSKNRTLLFYTLPLMKTIILILLLNLPTFCLAQEALQQIRKSSWQTQAYKVSAASVEDFIKWDSIPV
jgi:hypothetical protein